MEGNAVINEQATAGGRVTHKDIDTVEVSKRAIHNRYHQLYDEGRGMKQTEAYQQIGEWLVNDIGFTKEKIKSKFNITMNFDSFTRGASSIH